MTQKVINIPKTTATATTDNTSTDLLLDQLLSHQEALRLLMEKLVNHLRVITDIEQDKGDSF